MQCSYPPNAVLKAPRDAPFAAVRIEDELNTIPDQDFDAIHAHFSGKIGEYDALVGRELNSKERRGQSFSDDSGLYIFCSFFWHLCSFPSVAQILI